MNQKSSISTKVLTEHNKRRFINRMRKSFKTKLKRNSTLPTMSSDDENNSEHAASSQ